MKDILVLSLSVKIVEHNFKITVRVKRNHCFLPFQLFEEHCNCLWGSFETGTYSDETFQIK